MYLLEHSYGNLLSSLLLKGVEGAVFTKVIAYLQDPFVFAVGLIAHINKIALDMIKRSPRDNYIKWWLYSIRSAPIRILVTYSTTKPAEPPSRQIFLSTTNTIYKRQCINKIILLYLSKKAGLIQHFRPIPQAIFGAYHALQMILIYDISDSIIGFTELYYDRKYG